MRRLALPLLLALAAAPPPACAEYALVLPLQYNAFHPVSARALGCGDSWAAAPGLAALFADPAGLDGPAGPSGAIGGSAMSAFRSHEILATGPSRAVPATVIAGWGSGGQYLAIGARRSQLAALDFADPLRPQVAERLDLGHDQLRGAWRIAVGGHTRVALALGFDRLTMDWTDPTHRLARTVINSQAFALGCNADIRRDLTLGLFYRAKTTFEGATGFDYLDTLRTLNLLSIVPSAAGLAARWQVDSGFTAVGQLEFTGWQSVVAGYVGTLDWHLGLELAATPWLTLRTGGHSLATPIDAADRERRPDLHDLYFLTAGAGVRWWRITADLAAATSRPLSGAGLNQNIVAVTVGYSQRGADAGARPPSAAAAPAAVPAGDGVPEQQNQPSEEMGR